MRFRSATWLVLALVAGCVDPSQEVEATLQGPATQTSTASLVDMPALRALRMTATALEPAAPQSPVDAETARAQLVDVLGARYRDLGLTPDPAALAAVTGVSPTLAAPLAAALTELGRCQEVTRAALPSAPDVLAGLAELDLSHADAFDTCAARLWRSGLAIADVLAKDGAKADDDLCEPGPELDAWPVLRLGGHCPDVYTRDYLLLVDRGGRDTYMNNAGGNMIDLDSNDSVVCRDPSRDDGGLGGCAVGAALLVDQAGSDTYGVAVPETACLHQNPELPVEHFVERPVTIGAGLFGVGVLIEVAGDDTYLGRAFTQGTGHAGVGILDDHAGRDTYQAVRNGQGFGLTGGVGVLHERAGIDTYSYIPTLKGVWGGGECDTMPRQLQGSGSQGGEGVLIERAGADSYTAPTLNVRRGLFSPVKTMVGSQGFGHHGGTGALRDEAGGDKYAMGVAPGVTADPALQQRENGMTDIRTAPPLLPTSEDLAERGPTGPSIFIDRE
jgi:hypothetical protein